MQRIRKQLQNYVIESSGLISPLPLCWQISLQLKLTVLSTILNGSYYYLAKRPIVILARKENSSISKEVSPNQNTMGIMLPYTPLHYLLFSQYSKLIKRNSCLPPLVMTSGNLSEEPIAVNNDEASERLSGLADAYLIAQSNDPYTL